MGHAVLCTGSNNIPIIYIHAHLEFCDEGVQAVEVRLTQQRGVCLWWHLVHHPIAQEGQDACKVFRIPVQEVWHEILCE